MARNNGRDGIPRIGRLDRSAHTPQASFGDQPEAVSFGDQPEAVSIGDQPESGPVDIAAVRRDEEFIESIRGEGPIATDNAEEYQLALLLTSWRADITSPALPAGPDLDEVGDAVDREIAAVGLFNSARSRSTHHAKPGLLRPIAGAAAAIAVVMGGLVVFSYNSTPGDPLWSVKSVVFSKQADSTVAQIDTTSKLEEAEDLIASGDVSRAQALLEGASQSTGSVIDADRRSDLEMWLQRLQQQVQTVAPTVPPLPPAPEFTLQLPQLPLPEWPLLPIPSEVTTQPAPAPTSADVSVPPLTTAPVSPTPSEVPPPVTTTNVVPTTVKQPIPTTATASGSGAEIPAEAQTEILNGG